MIKEARPQKSGQPPPCIVHYVLPELDFMGNTMRTEEGAVSPKQIKQTLCLTNTDVGQNNRKKHFQYVFYALH